MKWRGKTCGVGAVTSSAAAENDDEEEQKGKGNSIVKQGKGFDMSDKPDLLPYNRQTFEKDEPTWNCSMIGVLLCDCTKEAVLSQRTVCC